MARNWDSAIQALVLVRLGQELGADSRLAQAVAAILDTVVSTASKFF